jgi:methyl-accepting chemotaxis protein
MSEEGKNVHMSTDITNHTHLLALNAAIETAQAGEVKNLARESKQATGNIEERISSLMKEREITVVNTLEYLFWLTKRT